MDEGEAGELNLKYFNFYWRKFKIRNNKINFNLIQKDFCDVDQALRHGRTYVHFHKNSEYISFTPNYK